MIQLTHDALDIPAIIASVTTPQAGGLNVFIGTIRNFNAKAGKAVLHLDYEAYEPMAVMEIQKIAEQVVNAHGVLKWAISHRIGRVYPGEPAVVIAVATTHRKESFQACQAIIDSLKATVPIWKREVFEGGEEWLEN